MRFAHPQVLWLLLALAPLAVFAWLRARAAHRALERALGVGMAARLTDHLAPRAKGLRLALLLGAVALLLVGAAQPQRGTHYVTAKRMGRDVVIALDVSESMLAEDLKPSRLQRAKTEIAAILDRLKGDRVALVAFAGSAYVQCPLTLDYGAARMFLDFMGPGLVPDPGTSLAEALRVSVRAFGPESEGFRALILITDGEDLSGGVEDATRAARAAGVKVFTVGIGSEAGEPIPERDADGKVTGYKKDKQGRVVMTRLDPEGLRTIARESGGLYVAAGGSLGLDRVLDEIEGMERREMSGGVRMLYEERYSYMVWPALLLLLAEIYVPRRRGARVTPRRVLAALRGGAALLLAAGLLAGARAQAPAPAPAVDPQWRSQLEENEVYRAAHPEDPRPLYNLGNLQQQKGDYATAEPLYRDAIGRATGDLAEHAAYNLGESLFRAEKLREARDAFLDALRRDPTDTDAKLNLELTQRRLDEAAAKSDSSRSAQPDSSGSSKQRQQKQQQQQQQQQKQQEQQQNGNQSPQEAKRDSLNPARADSVSADQLQTMQILRGLENQERQLLMHRFQARARNMRVEKDW
jgi:Ca-activated chloride channel homolog